MSIERIFRCDGPDCEGHVQTQGDHPPTMLTVFEEPGFAHEERTELHFCGWDCALKYGATFPPAEVIGLSD